MAWFWATPRRRWLTLGLATLAVSALTVLVLARSLGFWGPASQQPVEVAVYFPGTSNTAWLNWVEGVRLAAKEKNLQTTCLDENTCQVDTKPLPTVFKWYPTVGARQMQAAVNQRCGQQPHPLAVVGSTNSSLTTALAESLNSIKPTSAGPVLLMTDSTADGLIDVYPGRSFRFGFNNSYQAEMVVNRLLEFYRPKTPKKKNDSKTKVSPQPPKALVVKVADNPFAVDLAYHFEKELSKHLNVAFEDPESADGQHADRPEPKHAWTLSTATGRFSTPSSEESYLASQWARVLVAEPDRKWVLVWPVGTSAYRRLSKALADALREHPDADRARRVVSNIVVLSGDSLSYHSFDEPKRTQLDLEDRLKAPVIFFAHVNPDDPTVINSPCRMISSRALDREVARALLEVVPTLGSHPTPDGLIAGLKTYKPQGEDKKLFSHFERVVGGGAIVATPKHDANKFELTIPKKWKRPDNAKTTATQYKANEATFYTERIAAR